MEHQPRNDRQSVSLAMLQARAEPPAIARNLALVDVAALEASEAGADLRLTPELFVTDYALARIAGSVSEAAIVPTADRGSTEPGILTVRTRKCEP